MRIHLLATLALLAAAISTGCDSAREVRDSTIHTNPWGCDQCHGYPPPPGFAQFNPDAHPKGVTAPMCAVCHPSTVLADGHTIVANGTHRNGQVEVVELAPIFTPACDACHADPPPTGRHVFHVQTRGLACAICHKGYVVGDITTRSADPTLHMNGVADVVLPDGTVITTANLPDGSWPDSECAACHTALGVSGG
jgi:hypothetical protein